jgi:hypothetical protein
MYSLHNQANFTPRLDDDVVFLGAQTWLGGKDGSAASVTTHQSR